MTYHPLYTDHDSDDANLVSQLRAAGVDVLTSIEAGNMELGDEDQLAFATTQGRAVYTANKGDYALLQGRWAHAGQAHAGIIIRSEQQLDVGAQLRGLLTILIDHEADGLNDLILWI